MHSTETENVMGLVDFVIKSQGYVDIHFICRHLGIPAIIVENIFKNEGMTESGIPGQYIKSKKVI